MRFLTFLLLWTAVVLGEVFCVEDVENPTNDPYIGYSLQRVTEKALLEGGFVLSCEEGARRVRIRVISLEEIPIAYTPRQRVSSYNLILWAEVRLNGRSIKVGGAVPYTLPSGGYGDVPRRKAVDDLLDKVYLDLLRRVRELGSSGEN